MYMIYVMIYDTIYVKYIKHNSVFALLISKLLVLRQLMLEVFDNGAPFCPLNTGL